MSIVNQSGRFHPPAKASGFPASIINKSLRKETSVQTKMKSILILAQSF